MSGIPEPLSRRAESPTVTPLGSFGTSGRGEICGGAMSVLADRLGGLQAFFTQWRSLDTAGAALSTDRLSRFFEAAAPHFRELRRQSAPAPSPPILEMTALQTFLDGLRGPLEIARTDGARLNVWGTAGLKRDEVRNAGVLAALFDPNQSGDRAAAFLSAFLDRVQGADRAGLPTPGELEAGYSVQTEACPLGAADSRVDLSVEGSRFILLIEVKIDAGEGVEQLSRYAQVLRAKAMALNKRAALVYLSPTPAKAPPPATFYADWGAVHGAARAVVAAITKSDRTFQDQLLVQFGQHVRTF